MMMLSGSEGVGGGDGVTPILSKTPCELLDVEIARVADQRRTVHVHRPQASGHNYC
jgi:hypothetical protein